ncbi:MAG: hypothetical protein JXB23_14655 [Candidatus Aminicenantes bacterium]|nr:hypothetical protein [Candidatus Aminicenantes bacterium]
MKMSDRGMYFSRFMPSLERGGGSRRMMQIRSALDFLKPELVSSGNNDRLNHDALQRIKVNAEKKMVYHSRVDAGKKLWTDGHSDYVFRLREVSREWIGACPEIPALKIAIIDDPIYFVALFKHLKRNKIPIVAVCHNLEGLADDRMDKGPSLKLFSQEKSILSQCDLVITISNEESIILTNLGISCMHIPYYPVDDIYQRALAIRHRRERTEKRNVLLLGNARNSPTRRGMEEAVSYWSRNSLENVGGKLLIAGFHTDEFITCEKQNHGVDLLGPLSDEALDDTLAEVKACMCYQFTGAGALTRICEMLVAGVPVLANSHAARSYYGMKGLQEFRDLGELKTLLERMDSDSDSIPIPPRVNYAGLFNAVMSMIQGRDSMRLKTIKNRKFS